MDPAGSVGNIRNVVSQVTVKALQEFDTGDMERSAAGSAARGTVDEPVDHTHPDSSDDPSTLALVRRDREATMPPADTQDLIAEEGDEDDLDPDGDEDFGGDSDAELEENELVVLDPNHPLMKRFQTKLKEILVRRKEKLELELREVREALNSKKKEREEVGVDLYGVQQELARYQLTVENLQDELADLKKHRELSEQQLNEVRKIYKHQQTDVNEERKKATGLRAELDNISLRLFYLENAKDEVRSDISVMKRAAEKADSEVSRAEETKRKQDLFVNRLVEQLDRLREDIALYDAQFEAQAAETRAAREALTEAKTEIDAINVEKKQLLAAWNSALVGMRRRDEAHAAMAEAMHDQQQRMVTLEKEIDAFRRLTQQEQQNNEQLTVMLNKVEGEMATVKKSLAQCQAKYDALKEEYATYSRVLRETEESLKRASTEKDQSITQLSDIRKEIERCYRQKVQLEDEILDKMREQLTADKAAQYTERIIRRLRERTKDLETQIATLENDIAKSMLDNTQSRTQIDLLVKKKAELDSEMQSKDQLVAKIQSEISKNNTLIKRKTDQMEQLNSKIDKMIAQSGGVELGPLEIQINSLQKSIDAETQTISQLQNSWLIDQSELVRLTREHEEQSASVDLMSKQHVILTQKRLRVEADIESHKSEISSIEKEIHRLQIDLSKLDSLLYRERGNETFLQQDNKLRETEFMGSLKDAERESIQLQDKLEGLKEEKERMLNSLIESERQIMLWEKKTQLAKETRAAVDADFGQGEVAAMKSEIHRMQVRYNQLMKQQEKMIQEMEKTVTRRETIANRGDVLAKNTNNKVVTKGALHRQLADLRKKIKQSHQDAALCDSEIKALREQQQQLGLELDERQTRVQQLQGSMDTMDGDIERLMEQKQGNLADILADQQKTKYYQQVKENKYVKLCKTAEAIDVERQKQADRMNQVLAIVDRLSQDYPHAQLALRRVAAAYGSRGPVGQ